MPRDGAQVKRCFRWRAVGGAGEKGMRAAGMRAATGAVAPGDADRRAGATGGGGPAGIGLGGDFGLRGAGGHGSAGGRPRRRGRAARLSPGAALRCAAGPSERMETAAWRPRAAPAPGPRPPGAAGGEDGGSGSLRRIRILNRPARGLAPASTRPSPPPASGKTGRRGDGSTPLFGFAPTSVGHPPHAAAARLRTRRTGRKDDVEGTRIGQGPPRRRRPPDVGPVPRANGAFRVRLSETA